VFQISKIQEEWPEVAKQYDALWNFPHLLGAITGSKKVPVNILTTKYIQDCTFHLVGATLSSIKAGNQNVMSSSVCPFKWERKNRYVLLMAIQLFW
jgi:hypothetical protein